MRTGRTKAAAIGSYVTGARPSPLSREQIAKELRKRAEEVVFADWTGSGFKTVNTDSYPVWQANNWWMLPWEDKLEDKTSKPLNGFM